MIDKKQEFLKRILATFRIEAEENLISLSAKLIELEKEPPDEDKEKLLELIYRSAHSLKGASRAINLTDIGRLCHGFEDVISALRNNEIILNKNAYDILHQVVNTISQLVDIKEEDISQEFNIEISRLIENMTIIESGSEFTSPSPKAIHKPSIKEVPKTKKNNVVNSDNKKAKANSSFISNTNASNDTIRIKTSKLDNILVEAEEMLAIKLSSVQNSKYLLNIHNKLNKWSSKANDFYDIKNKLQIQLGKQGNYSDEKSDLRKLIEYSNWSEKQLNNIKKEINNLQKFSMWQVHSTTTKVDDLLDDVRDLIRVPFSSLLDVFPKMVRDISNDLGKEITFEVSKNVIEIDRRILEKIKDPLIHIVRNSIDYGIEKPEVRKKLNKHSVGKISINIEQIDNNKIEILITDDGSGINIEKLKKIYAKQEKIADNNIQNISEKDCLNYIFSSGVTTSDIVTELSGRGLGLAIVQDAIDDLGGSIDVESEKNKFTIFRIKLPLSVVTFRGILLETSNFSFIAPTSKLLNVIRVNINEIKTIENKATISYKEKIIPLFSLHELLELPKIPHSSEYIQIIVFEIKGKKLGISVDKVVGEQEVLVKKFNKQLQRIRNISGATILGSGEMVPILNVTDLFKSANKLIVADSDFTNGSDSDNKTAKSILVVEDSITSRTLLKNILEASGYVVTTSVDGVDGYMKLQEERFDAVVSDVEMPRMNGFELTEKIRANKKTEEIPVLLVTSLSKREDKERGIDVGANAYIVKSSFDQSNLLEILERLI